MNWKFEFLAGPMGFTEGPVWDGSGLLFTNISENHIMRFEPNSGQINVFRAETNEANGLTLDKDGRLYACEGRSRRIVRYDPNGKTTIICDRYHGKKLNSPNDLTVDNSGRIWFTDPRYGEFRDDMELGHESVYRLSLQSDGSWEPTRMTYDTTAPNGIVLSRDNKVLYVAESKYGENEKRELRAYPLQDDGTLGPSEVLHNFYPHRGIDGMCLDREGNIIATAGWDQSGPGPMIYVLAKNGRVLETHPFPVNRPTNCAFGDADLRTLYVTSFEGYLFRARTDREGYPLFEHAQR